MYERENVCVIWTRPERERMRVHLCAGQSVTERERERARKMAEVSGWREKDLGVTSQGKVFNLMDANIPTTDVR